MDSDRMPQEDVEQLLLGGRRKYTRLEVAAKADVPAERIHRLWRALGFAAVDDDEIAFTDADVEAARIGYDLLESGLIDQEFDASVTRALGHYLSRLAEWQANEIWDRFGGGGRLDEAEIVRIAEAALPTLERLQNYVWRRHLAAFTGRLLDAAPRAATHRQVIGFVDMVGYTRLTRQVDDSGLVEVLERFESAAADVISERRGRIVKMIGDEVLFVADDPAAAAEIALTLRERAGEQTEFPELRTGLAYGHVLSRLGDVYGEVVNIAARLTSIARPNSILVDEQLAAQIEGKNGFSLRALRPAPVRGYSKLKPYVLRRRTAATGPRDRHRPPADRP